MLYISYKNVTHLFVDIILLENVYLKVVSVSRNYVLHKLPISVVTFLWFLEAFALVPYIYLILLMGLTYKTYLKLATA